MSIKGKKIVWKAADGREFLVDTSDCETMEDVQEKVSQLRREHGYEEPTFMSVQVNDPTVDLGPYMHEDDIKDPELREKIKAAIREGMNKPDPKKLN